MWRHKFELIDYQINDNVYQQLQSSEMWWVTVIMWSLIFGAQMDHCVVYIYNNYREDEQYFLGCEQINY